MSQARGAVDEVQAAYGEAEKSLEEAKAQKGKLAGLVDRIPELRHTSTRRWPAAERGRRGEDRVREKRARR